MVSSSSPPINFDVAIQKIVREEWGYLLSSLIKSLNDLTLAEDALQDAVEAALHHWRRNGLPKAPNAWLLTTAKRKAIDKIRRDRNFDSKKQDYLFLTEPDSAAAEDEFDVPDERLRLIFTCCHPALDKKISVALTLQLLGGLSTAEISHAFLITRETMAQRLVRGKRKIKQAAIPFVVPDKSIFSERLDAVLSVLYLIFNEGYSATSGEKHVRGELCNEAIRLARILYRLRPTEPEVIALLALMLIHDSRRTARFSGSGELVTLENQDRRLWKKDQINEGKKLVEEALGCGNPGPYQIQAAISAVHADAASYDETDWREIALLYQELYKLNPTPVIELNRLVALSYFTSAEEQLDNLNRLESEFRDYQPFYAAKADFLNRCGHYKQAIKYYKLALKHSGNENEKQFFERRLKSIMPLQEC